MEGIKNILFISYDGMTDPLGQSQVIPYLKGLTAFGYHFTILSCDKKERYVAHQHHVSKSLEGFPITWISLPYHKFPPVISSVYDYYMLRKKAVELHRKNPFHLVHTRPGVPALAGLWLKKYKGIRFLNDIRGFWADERVDGGMWNLDKPLYRRIYNFFKNHEYECLEEADYNVCLTQAAKKEILEWSNIKKNPLKLEVIPCSVDLELFNPESITEEMRDSIRKELGIDPADEVISYLGSVGGWYLTKEMLQMCYKIYLQRPQAKFLFISPYNHEGIMQMATSCGIPATKIITYAASRHEVPLLLSLSKFSLFFIKPCYSKISSSPTKHAEIMAMDIPLITNKGVGDVSEIIEEFNSGILLKNFSDDEMTRAAKEMYSRSFEPGSIRTGAMKFYALQHAVLKYRSIYSEIFSQEEV
ncbi:MAG: glycosyltransferase [Ferruginibacter sp.]